jgi:hypothetical protein
MVKAIMSQSIADQEWRAWKIEQARRHKLAQDEKDYKIWKEQQKKRFAF